MRDIKTRPSHQKTLETTLGMLAKT